MPRIAEAFDIEELYEADWVFLEFYTGVVHAFEEAGERNGEGVKQVFEKARGSMEECFDLVVDMPCQVFEQAFEEAPEFSEEGFVLQECEGVKQVFEKAHEFMEECFDLVVEMPCLVFEQASEEAPEFYEEGVVLMGCEVVKQVFEEACESFEEGFDLVVETPCQAFELAFEEALAFFEEWLLRAGSSRRASFCWWRGGRGRA